jgi:hypothetical protein
LSVLPAPTRGSAARTVVREAAARFGSLLRLMPDVVTFADCGRVTGEVPVWAMSSSLVLLTVRQAATSAGATAARVDRAGEALAVLRSASVAVGVVVIGARPYDPGELVEVIGGDLYGVLPEDPIGAGLAAGAWTVGRGASRSALARAGRPVAAHLVDAVAGVGSVVPLDQRTGAVG